MTAKEFKEVLRELREDNIFLSFQPEYFKPFQIDSYDVRKLCKNTTENFNTNN